MAKRRNHLDIYEQLKEAMQSNKTLKPINREGELLTISCGACSVETQENYPGFIRSHRYCKQPPFSKSLERRIAAQQDRGQG